MIHTIPAGTVVELDGIPFILSADTQVECRQDTFDIAVSQIIASAIDRQLTAPKLPSVTG